VQANDTFENATHAITGTTNGLHGTTAINTNGTAGDTTDDVVTYTPSADYNGPDSFTYTVTSNGTTETATVNVTVSAVSDIVNDIVAVGEDSGANTLNLLANDSFENASRAIAAVGVAAHGTTAINTNGTPGNFADDFVIYTPNVDFNGSDSFTYTVTSNGTTETATVNVTINAVADIANDTATTGEETAVNILVQANDTFENPNHAITGTTNGLHGTVAVNNNDTPGNFADDFVTYTPNADFNGADSFTYTVTSGGAQETATVNVTVNAVNDAPVFSNLGGGSHPSFVENGSAVVLDDNVTVSDLDLNAADGSYGGTVLTLVRNGGANPDDTFGATGSLDLIHSNSRGENVSLNSGATFIGTFSQPGDGAFSITFNSGATAANVASVMQQIVYANVSDNPPASVQIDWSFSDGNSGAQGTGGAGVANGAVTVDITQVDDAPPLVDLDASGPGTGFTTTYTENTVAIPIVDTDVSITDPTGRSAALDSATIVLTNAKPNDHLTIAGTLPSGIDSSIDTSVTGKITVHLTNSATLSDYQTALSQIRFSTSDLSLVDRDITVTVSGTEADSNVAHATVHVTPFHLAGTPGNDSFTALPGSGIIDADGGIDTIAFDFRLIDATVTYSGNKVIIDSASSHTVLTGFETFVFTDGIVNNNDGSWLIDDLYYYSQYHDVWNAHADADAHYNSFGWHEDRNPNAFFGTGLYLSLYQDVKAAGVNPLTHFDSSGWIEHRIPSFNFDPNRYLSDNPDVAAAHIDPLEHFLHYGAQEGRQPTAPTGLIAANGFDSLYYLKNNPDVLAAHVDPFAHFQTVGWHEGRNPNTLFDTNGYLATYPDVAAANVNPLDHYHVFGWTEGRDPSVGFDTTSYLAAYTDVAAAHVDPLKHFIEFGQSEGRSSFADGMWG
jgi:FKBP-type peptidyl-prolyl cis-trans isomerase 2